DNYSEKAMPIANAALKKLCIENWDTNGDGVFSFGEAAAVTDLGEVFKGKTTITAFTELYNFTGLTSISDDAFNGCTKLASVKLPRHLKHIGARAFNNCRALKTLTLPAELESIGEGAFTGCRVLPNLTIPAGIKRIEANTFESCLAFTAVELPLSVQYIGAQAFKDCTKLTAFTLNGICPQNITLGESVFEGAKLSEATLNIPQGCLAYFVEAAQWKEFGNICEYRTLAQGKFAALAVNTPFYIYNVGTGRYLTKGEAYGTQAIVDNTDTPMRYELRRSASMPGDTYYLYSDDTGNSTKHIIFRTNTDTSVGSGVNACFIDGTLSDKGNKTYWKVQPVENAENIYTFQMPQNQT
ncbi:MAG: leucine-rich repeat domain-containing protein, partial [Bacteroidaceae bacterium]|nr:leucine-rich repeat domain-containing protein [Bacteroidaceae bacterium]